MHNKKSLLIALAAVTLILLAGCSSYNDNSPYGTGGSNNNITGTVDYVDSGNRTIVLTNTNNNGMYSSSSNLRDTMTVYYDNNTRVSWNGRTYRPEDLERGDQVDVRASNSNGHLVADSVTVTYNNASTASSSQYPSSNYPNNGTRSSTIDGTVRSVDTSRHQIAIDRGYGSTTWIDYDNNTSVIWNGRTYMPRDLEPGDQVSISTYDTGGGRLRATSVNVTRSVNGGNGTYNGSTSSSNYSTLRGTVRNLDTNSHTIELDQSTWLSGFNTNRSTNNGIVLVQFDPGVQVDVNGTMNPVNGLERGDVVEVQVSPYGNSQWLANRITLVRNVRQ